MKATVDISDELLSKAERAAIQRQMSLSELVAAGLDMVLKFEAKAASPVRARALQRMEEGIDLGGKPLTREKAHERGFIY